MAKASIEVTISAKGLEVLANLAKAAAGVLSMGDLKHPDGFYTLAETGHFQSLRKAMDELEAHGLEILIGENKP